MISIEHSDETRNVGRFTGNLSLRKCVGLDWELGVTYSSEVQKMGQVFVRVKLHSVGSNGHFEAHVLELSLKEFYQLLAHFETIQSRMTL